MAFLITGIFSIDPKLIEFTGNKDGTGDIVHPTHAYEVLAEIDGKKYETDGVVWQIEEPKQTVCFIDEEFEEFLVKSFPEKFTDEKRDLLSKIIYDKYRSEEIELPLTIWE